MSNLIENAKHEDKVWRIRHLIDGIDITLELLDQEPMNNKIVQTTIALVCFLAGDVTHDPEYLNEEVPDDKIKLAHVTEGMYMYVQNYAMDEYWDDPVEAKEHIKDTWTSAKSDLEEILKDLE